MQCNAECSPGEIQKDEGELGSSKDRKHVQNTIALGFELDSML